MDEYLRFRDGFAQAMNPDLYTIQYLDHLYLSGRAKMFSSANAAGLVEIRSYPTGKFDVHGLVCTGDLNEILNILIPQAEAWGREEGCAGLIIESREGWVRALKGYGYSPHQIAVRK